jgi:hypothetical protein
MDFSSILVSIPQDIVKLTRPRIWKLKVKKKAQKANNLSFANRLGENTTGKDN